MDFTPAEFETYALQRGDLLLSEASGSASEVGKPAVWNNEGLRLAGRGEKIHEMVCRYGGRVPIREVWRARAMTAAVRRVLGLSETLGTCASSASNETRRS